MWRTSMVIAGFVVAALALPQRAPEAAPPLASHDPASEAVLAARQDAVMRPIASIDGRRLYTAYCSQCHGPAGKGDGVRASSLATRPPDLTQIAKRNDGKFNREFIVQYIMGSRPGGRSQVVAGRVAVKMNDGTISDMPSWGNMFRKMWPDDPKRLRFDNLARYLDKIQEK